MLSQPPNPNEVGGTSSSVNTDTVLQATLLNSNEIELLPSENGKDRYVIVEKITAETVSPLVKKEVVVDGIYEVIDRNFSYPYVAHVGMKFDSRTFSGMPSREFDVKMKKVKVPSNYFPTGGNGLDRRYVFANPDYPANPNSLDVIFMVDQNMNAETRRLIRRNLQEMIFKLVAGYTNIRFSIWQAKSGFNTVINESTGDTVVGFTYYNTASFAEMETPDSAGANQTNMFKQLDSALDISQLNNSLTNPSETNIANFFFRKNQFSLTDEVGKLPEKTVLQNLWKNTVRKVVYFSGSTPETMSPETYQILLNRARESGIQLYYLNTDPDRSGTRTLRELAEDTGGAKFNLAHDSDSKLQQFCNSNFYDSNKIYYGDWDGTFKIAWTDNPAWILYDIITDFNYGLGNLIESSLVDKWTLYDIGRHCDAVDDDGRFRGVPDGKGGLEPRYTCNIIFFNKDEAYNVLKDLAAIFKGMIYWTTGGFSFIADKKKEPLVYFANANVKEGLFNYSETAKNKRYTSVEVTYNDKFDNYKTKVEFVEDVDGILKYGLNPYKINAAGCTSRSEARRIGRYALTSSIHETDTVTFVAGLEGAYLQPGDVFGISDEVKNVGRSFGRILEVNEAANTIKIDGEFNAGLDSGVYIHVPSGNFSLSDLNSLTGGGGDFTGTLEQIRARRQKQTRKFNIHTVINNIEDPNAYGAILTLTGDFLLKSVVHDVHPSQSRVSGSLYTGLTTLTGVVYNFPPHTVANGNPKWDTLTFSGVSGVLSNLEIDIDFSGNAGTGLLIPASTQSWVGVVSGFNNTSYTQSGDFAFTIANNGREEAVGTAVIYSYNSAGVNVNSTLLGNNINSIWSNPVYIGASAGDVVIAVWPSGTLEDSTTPNAIWSTGYAATEVFKLGLDTNTSKQNCLYCVALIKGGYRLLEAGSKRGLDYPGIKFNYRDLLAYSKLQPYYTFVQADFGNMSNSNLEEWKPGRDYVIGATVKHGADTYFCVRDHTSKEYFTEDYLNEFTRQCDIATLNKNIGLTTQSISQLGGVAVGMYVAGSGIPENSRINSISDDPNSITFHIDKNPTLTRTNETVTFASTPGIGNNTSSTKWTRGNSDGYYSVGLPKDFYGTGKIPLTTTLTSALVSGAFTALGLEVYVGGGTLGQSDLKSLPESNGIGYSGLVYGTGYPKGIYSLTVDTTPQNLDLVSEGSLYVLSGSGVEPKLYKTIATKEEEANQYGIVGIEYLNNKDDYIEKDILDTSPSYYVQGPYDVVVKPNPPSGIQSISGFSGTTKYTGIHIIWSGTNSPITGYKVYVSKPDYSTTNEYDSIVQAYSTPSGIHTLTIPITGSDGNDIWGQYDFKIYSQGTTYKLLSDYVATGIVMLPSANLKINDINELLTSTIPSGFTIDTADQDSVKYSIGFDNGTYSGNGRGNWTSKDLVFRWKYLDPTGGKMATKEQIYENPFVDLPQKVTVQVLDSAGQVIKEEKNYQGLSYRITQANNAAMFDSSRTPESIEYSREIGLRVIVTDNTNLSKTGTFQAVNQYPGYSRIQVIDSFQNSPYQILSGYYGNRNFTGLAVWSPDVASTIGAITTISGSGVRDAGGNLLRSEDESVPLTFRDISGAFSTATFYNGTGLLSGTRAAVGINVKGTGEPDFETYVYKGGTMAKYGYESKDLIEHYEKYVDKSKSISKWGAEHYSSFGQFEGRELSTKEGNPLGICNLHDITLPNKTGFSGIAFSVLPEPVSKSKIIFNCFNATSNKDVLSVDVYTGVGYTNIINHTSMEKDNYYEIVTTGSNVNWKTIGHDSNTPILGSEFQYNGQTINGTATVKRVFTPDLVNHTNKFATVSLTETRSYLNVITLGERLPTGEWLYFRFRPWDDYGPGFTSKVVSGYLEMEQAETTPSTANRYFLDGGRDQKQAINVSNNNNPLIKNLKYKIEQLGNSEINWVAIGADSPTLNVEFTYNGGAVSGGGTTVGKVKQVEIKFNIPTDQINKTNLVTPISDSTMVLPTEVAEGDTIVIINAGLEYSLFIESSNGELISTIRPGERAEITRDENEWRDDRGRYLAI